MINCKILIYILHLNEIHKYSNSNVNEISSTKNETKLLPFLLDYAQQFIFLPLSKIASVHQT